MSVPVQGHDENRGVLVRAVCFLTTFGPSANGLTVRLSSLHYSYGAAIQ